MTNSRTPLYIVCSPFRCVGKTLISRLLIERCVIDGRPVAAFDLADEGPQLADYLPDLTTIGDIEDTTGQMAFFERLLADDDTTKVVDLSHRNFKNFFSVAQKIGFFEEAHRRGVEPIVLFIIDPDPKSAKAYAMLRRWFTSASLLPVHNQIAASEIPSREASANGAAPASLEIPALAFSLRALVDRQSFSFAETWRTPPADFTGAMEDEFRLWLEYIFIQFRKLALALRFEEPPGRAAAPASNPVRMIHRQRPRDARPPDGNSQRDLDSVAVKQRASDIPKGILDYAPKQKPRADSDTMDHSGNAIYAPKQKPRADSDMMDHSGNAIYAPKQKPRADSDTMDHSGNAIYAPKQKPRADSDTMDHSGNAVYALKQKPRADSDTMDHSGNGVYALKQKPRADSDTMDHSGNGVYALKQKSRADGDTMDHSGNAIVAMLQKAANMSYDDRDRAMTMADELSVQLRAAEDRIVQLETEIQRVQDRAVRAETWLQLIQKEIEKLMPSAGAVRPKSSI